VEGDANPGLHKAEIRQSHILTWVNDAKNKASCMECIPSKLLQCLRKAKLISLKNV
jgi:hypothetical protein